MDVYAIKPEDREIKARLSLSTEQIIEVFKNKQVIKIPLYGYLICEYQPEKEGINPFSMESFKIPPKMQPTTLDPQLYINLKEYLDKSGLSMSVCEILVDEDENLDARQFIADNTGEVIGKLEFIRIRPRDLFPSTGDLPKDEYAFVIKFSKSFIEKVRDGVNTSYELVTEVAGEMEDRLKVTKIVFHSK